LLELIARKFVVTELFETSEAGGNVVLAHPAVELLRPGNALHPPELRRERPEISEVASLDAVQDREDPARCKVLGGE
jgi:hypothetical protein